MPDPVGQIAGTQQSLSDWAAPYVTDLIGKGKALGEQAYTGYSGPLTAGQSNLQTQAFQGIGSLKWGLLHLLRLRLAILLNSI